MTNYMQASIGRVSFENDHFEESRKERTTYIFFGGNSSYYEKKLVKKDTPPFLQLYFGSDIYLAWSKFIRPSISFVVRALPREYFMSACLYYGWWFS